VRVYGLLTANTPRRILSLAVAAIVPAAVTAVLALAAPAQASPVQASPVQASAVQASAVQQASGLSVVIDSMSPQAAGPGATVTVSGTVSNDTSRTQAGLDVQLWTSPDRFQTRDAMDVYVNHGTGGDLVEANSAFIAASLKPGATASWHASFQVDVVGMTQFGVYPVSAQLVDGQGDVLAVNQTLLPFWPGQQAAGLARPLDISWVWPLIDQPHHQVCSALTNNDLATSLAPGGRLASLLDAGQANPNADLTWVIDPALLSDVDTMTRTYQVDSGTGCGGAPYQPASKTARNWLSGLRAVTSAQPAVITPYANVDVSALVHSGLTADITSAYQLGSSVAGRVLGGSFGPRIAVPAGGTADLSVLTNLVTTQHISTVVLDSNEMPPTNPAVFADDAVTSITVAGLPMTVLLADHTLTKVLAAGDTSAGGQPAGTQFAVSQRFLAETAMIAAEAPSFERSIVVEPPENWSPSASLAGQLLSETTAAPWLRPTALGKLSAAPDSERKIARQPPPANQDSPGELSGSYLSQVSEVGNDLDTYEDLLYRPASSYLEPFSEALIATESSAWRGSSGESKGLALARKLSKFMSGEESRIAIIAAQQVPMGGSSGPVPVSVQNESHHPIVVELNANVLDMAGRTSQLTIGHFDNVMKVQPGQAVTVRLPVSSAPIGPTAIKLSLTTTHGQTLPVQQINLTVESTRDGRTILFLIAAAIGVLLLTSVFRGLRRRLRPDTQVVPEDADLPGSVMTGTSSARDQTEAPDDLADARRWADDA
jgi:hypothetical protein